MSTVDDIRQRVLVLAREIEKLADSGLPPDQFFDQFLERLTRAVGARAGAIWMKQETGQLELFCEHQLSETELDAVPGALEANEKLIFDVMTKGQAKAYTHANGQATLPTSEQLIVAPLRSAKASVGAVEIFQRPEAPAAAIAGYLQFIEQMCGHACRYLEHAAKPKTAQAPAEADPRRDQFLLRLHRSLVTNEVAAISASDGRQLIGCDRAAVSIRRGRKSVVLAISGQDSVNRRSKLVRKMSRLIASVIETRKPLIYAGTLDNLAPQIEEPLAEYVQESGARMVIVTPLLEPSWDADADDVASGTKKRPPKVIGGMIVEQFSASRPIPGVEDNTARIAEHVSSALYNARSHERLLFTPVRRLLGSGRSLFEGKLWLKIAAVLAAIGAIAAALVFIPYEYRVEGSGILMPVVQRSVFAPQDGDVTEVMVASSQRVKKGQPLLRMRNDDLHSKMIAAQNALFDAQNRVLGLQAELDEAVGKADRKAEVRIEGEINKTAVEVEGAKKQVELLESEESKLLVLAPIDGVVVTFQIDQVLKDRPVRRGDLLVEVMDDKGPWHLELELEEKRMGHLLRAIDRAETLRLPLEFVLATNVESTYTGTVERIANRADEAESGNIVEIMAEVDAAELPAREIGAEVTAKIDCGKRSLGYVLFGDVVEFLQKYLWL